MQKFIKITVDLVYRTKLKTNWNRQPNLLYSLFQKSKKQRKEIFVTAVYKRIKERIKKSSCFRSARKGAGRK